MRWPHLQGRIGVILGVGTVILKESGVKDSIIPVLVAPIVIEECL